MGNKIKVSKSTYGALLIAFSVILIVVLGTFIIKPLYEDNVKTSGIIERKRDNLNILEDKADKLKELSANEKEIESNALLTLESLPNHIDKSRLYIQFEKLAQNSGLILASLREEAKSTSGSKEKVVLSDSFNETSFTVNLKGNYTGLKQFLTSVGDARRIMNVQSVSVKRKSSDDLDITLKLSTFYGKQGDINEKN